MKQIKESELMADLRAFVGDNVKSPRPTPEELEAIMCRKKLGITVPVFRKWFEKKFGRKISNNYIRWQEYKHGY